jgi:hypothetical protein
MIDDVVRCFFRDPLLQNARPNVSRVSAERRYRQSTRRLNNSALKYLLQPLFSCRGASDPFRKHP